jgi:hypothetical protein
VNPLFFKSFDSATDASVEAMARNVAAVSRRGRLAGAGSKRQT